jgi:putative ABC transport system permease protein
MRITDLARAACGGLWRQKARTLLTLTGVVVGTCSFAFSLSLGVGLRAMIDREFQRRDEFWWVHAHSPRRGTAKESDADIPPAELAVDGNLSPEAVARIRAHKAVEYRQRTPPKHVKLITPEMIERMRALADVEEVRVSRNGYGIGTVAGRNADAFVAATRLDIYDPPYEDRLLAGRMPADVLTECLISEYVAYKLGARDPAAVSALVGRTLTLTVGEPDNQQAYSLAGVFASNPKDMISAAQAEVLGKIVSQFPEKIDAFDLSPAEKGTARAALSRPHRPGPKRPTAKGTYTVAGVFRLVPESNVLFEPNPSKVRAGNQGLQLTVEAGDVLFSQLRESHERGVTDVHVRCRPHGNLRGVVEGVEALGVEQYSSLKWYEAAKLEVTLISVGLNVFSLVALLIAGIGITNTLVTSVLERTREIGVLKAVGAKDGDVSALFLAEGAAVGLAGGVLGIVAARLVAGPADGIVHNLVSRVSQQKMITDSVFTFPWWLTVGAVLFAVLVTTAAAWYPARRAARVEPVEALRHE